MEKERKILKFNHYLFVWYYKRVPEHFRQWNFVKSVKLLIENYTSLDSLYDKTNKMHSECIREIDRLRTEISNMKMQQMADSGTIKDLNKMFGTKFTPPTDN